jgi:hypothetical protein
MISVAKNLALVFVSALLALVLAEGVLRFALPRYEYAAASVHERDAGRLIVRRPGARYTRPHPDSGVRHEVIHNNLALHQHRDVQERKPLGQTRIGIFGDSFTENVRVAAPHAFGEVLDFLLNRVSARPLEVLNFGVDGYATDQSWLYYENAETARNLDVVLYVFAANDVRGLYENALLRLGPDGELERLAAPRVAWWIPWVSRLHITYLALDVRSRLAGAGSGDDFYDPMETRVVEQMRNERDERTRDVVSDAIATDFKEGRVSPRSREWVDLLQHLLRRWRADVEAHGGRLYVVLLPRPKEGLAEPIFAGLPVINLWREFEARGWSEEPWRFANDPHWNELGNARAATVLYERLARDLGLDAPPADPALAEWYGVFDAGDALAGRIVPAPTTAERAAELRDRYVPLETHAGDAVR